MITVTGLGQSETTEVGPRRLDDRRGSRGPAGGRRRACPSRLEDVASARDESAFSVCELAGKIAG